MLALTVEPLGVVLGAAQRRHVAQAPVDDGVAAWEVDDGGGVELAALRQHGGGVVARVVRAAGHAVHRIQHAAGVADLMVVGEGGGREVSWSLDLKETSKTLIPTWRVTQTGAKALVPQVKSFPVLNSNTRM